MWRRRDHERFIGSYDPEHEMPDPDRDRGDRWQSDVYRHNARDGRFAYRWNPDRFEEFFRNRGDYSRPGPATLGPRSYGGYGEYSDYDRGFDHGYNRGYDRGIYGRGSDYDRAREFGGRGYERDWRDRQRFDRDDYRTSEFNDDDYDRWRNRRW